MQIFWARLKVWKLILGQCEIWESLGVKLVFPKKKRQIRIGHVASSEELIPLSFLSLSFSSHLRLGPFFPSLSSINSQQPIPLGRASPAIVVVPPLSLSLSLLRTLFLSGSSFLSLSLSSSRPSSNHHHHGSADDTSHPAKFRGCRCGDL